MSTNDPLYCICCDYKAKFQSEYNKHINSQKHLRQGKKKDYKCESCDYTATTHWNLKMHMVLKHYTLEQKKELEYYCSVCDNVTFSKLYYENHINSTAHKNNMILNNIETNTDVGIKLYKQTKNSNNKTNIELVANINNDSQLENNLKVYIKEQFDIMKKEIISIIKSK